MMSSTTQTPRGTIGIRDENQEIDSLLCSLHRVTTSLHEGVEATRRTAEAQVSRTVDFSQFEARVNRIATLRHLNSELLELTAVVAHHEQAADALHQEELASMLEHIDSTRPLASSHGPPGQRARQPGPGAPY